MKRILAVFTVLVIALSFGLWVKVRENEAAMNRPSGGSGSIEGQSFAVSSRIASRIVKLHVEEGAPVEKGALLVELDCEEQASLQDAAQAKLRSAESAASAAQAQLEAATGTARAAQEQISAAGAQAGALERSREVSSKTANRLTKLRGEGGVTEAELDRASSQVEQLGEQIKALEAQQRAAKNQAAAARAQAEVVRRQAEAAVAGISAAQADVRRTRALVAECTLKAPASGIVLTRAFEEGEALLPGSRVLEVVALDPVETTFYLPNRELSVAAPGKPVTVIADAYPGRTFKGEIAHVAAEAEFTPRNVQTREDRDRLVYAVKVRIPNPDRALRPGMPVEVMIDGTGTVR
jgi:HlyD family secretion protein